MSRPPGLDPIGTREMKDLILSLKAAGQNGAAVQPSAGGCAGCLRPDHDSLPRAMQTIGQVRDLLQVKDVTQIQTRGMSGASASRRTWAMSGVCFD
jgi:ABC-2 type transport system ATP-binding protein